jgi:hypothetical protein
MPIQYGRDDEHRRLRVMLTGSLTLADLIGVVDYAVRSGQDLRMQVFWDVDEAERWLESKP